MDSAVKSMDSVPPTRVRDTKKRVAKTKPQRDAVAVARKIMKRHPKTFANLAK